MTGASLIRLFSTAWPFLVLLVAARQPQPDHPGPASAWPGFSPGTHAQVALGPLGPEQTVNPKPRVGYVALGDSYGAGIGTGLNGGDEDNCRLGMHAYPALISADLSRSHPPFTNFQWQSCTGATVTDLLFDKGQIASLNRSLPADFATLSIGGNDLGFFDVINACVFRFYSFYSGTCDSALQRAAALVAGQNFDIRLQIALLALFDSVRWERNPRFRVVVTGYARFFDAATEACDEASLGVWWGGPKLPVTLRIELNSLVLAANAKLRRAVEIFNARFTGRPRPKALFVDYDDAFERHRFCEPGVSEPDYTREDTWFFLVGGPDNSRNGSSSPNVTAPRPPHQSGTISSGVPQRSTPQTSRLVDPDRCLKPAQDAGDWGMLALCYMAMAKKRDPSLRLASGELLAQDNAGWYVPTYYGKVFHPRSLGHEAIRDSIYREWNATFGEDLISRGLPGVLE